MTIELDAIVLLIERCACPTQRERLLELNALDQVSEILTQTPLSSSLVSQAAKLLALLASDFHAREKISTHPQLMTRLTNVLIVTKDEEISDFLLTMARCPRTAARLVPVLDSVRTVLEANDPPASTDVHRRLCACAALVVDAQPTSAEIFTCRNLLLSEIMHFDFLAALGRASVVARKELLATPVIVEISVHKLSQAADIAPLRLLEALAIEPEGKFAISQHGTGILSYLAGSLEISADFRSTLHRLIRSVAEYPAFLDNVVEILQADGLLLRTIFGNLALKPLCKLLPSSLALHSFHEILTQSANAVMLSHFVCPQSAWRSPREFAISECVSVHEKLRACLSSHQSVAQTCLDILM